MVDLFYFLPRHDLYDPASNLMNDLDLTSDYGFLRSIAGFMTGMLLYLLYCKETVGKLFRPAYVTVLTALFIIYSMHKDFQDLLFIPAFSILILRVPVTPENCLSCLITARLLF